MAGFLSRFTLLLLLLLCGTATVQAADSGKTRYSALFRALEPGLVFEKFDQLVTAQHVYSKRADVATGDIRITIASRSGKIYVQPQPDGRVDFPMTDALLAENPWVESNQPQGSLGLSATMEIRQPKSLEFPYATLYRAMQQAQSALQQLGPELATRKVRGADFVFAPESNAEVTIEDQKSDSLIVANSAGVVTIRMDERWVKSAAVVKLKRPALAIRPRVE